MNKDDLISELSKMGVVNARFNANHLYNELAKIGSNDIEVRNGIIFVEGNACYDIHEAHNTVTRMVQQHKEKSRRLWLL